MEEKIKALEAFAKGLHDKAVALEQGPYAHLLKEDAVKFYHDLADTVGHIKDLFAPGPSAPVTPTT
jgi:hypothetical protein